MMVSRKEHSGFSLLELLITLGVMLTLGALTVPVYSQYVRQGYRMVAQNALSQLALALETYHFAHHSYRDASLVNLKMPSIVAEGRYQLVIQQQGEQHFLLAAIPQGTQQADACGSLFLNELGQQTASRNPAEEKCW